ncbi:hypothetical protein ACFLYH_02180 [Candidatus Dependentiae bacterium]
MIPANKILNTVFVCSLFFTMNAKDVKNVNSYEFGNKDLTIVLKSTDTTINKDEVILNTINELAKNIDPKNAAKMYLKYTEEVFSIVKNSSVTMMQALKACKTKEEAAVVQGNYLRSMSETFGKKDNALKQASLFASFSDEVIKEIQQSLAQSTQVYLLEIQISAKKLDLKTDDVKAKARIVDEHGEFVKNKTSEFFDKVIDSMKNVFKKHYKI